jgi:pimeloyl-ACP methyl ester carboxylesterase
MPTLDSPSTIGKRIQLGDGRSLGYAEYGDPAGKPVLFFHGTPAPTQHVTAEGLLRKRVLLSPHFTPTAVRAPISWARSTGAGVVVAVTRNHDEDVALVNLVAPGATVEPLEMDEQMHVGWRDAAGLLERRGIRILAIIEPGDFDPQALRDGVGAVTRAGVAVFVNGTLSERSLDFWTQ